MTVIRIAEDKLTRRWWVKTLNTIYFGLLKKYGPLSIFLILVVQGFYSLMSIPLSVCRAIQCILGFPILCPLAVIVASPVYLLPQSWELSTTKVKGRGFIEFGSIKVKSITSWSIIEVADLPGYHVVKIQSKSLFGGTGQAFEIIAPPVVDLKKIEQILSQNKNGA